MVMSWGRASISSLVMTLCCFAGGLDGVPGFAGAGFAGVCGQFAVQGAALLCGEEPAGSGDCAKAGSPEIEKTNARTKIWGRTERILLSCRNFILPHAGSFHSFEVGPTYRKRYQRWGRNGVLRDAAATALLNQQQKSCSDGMETERSRPLGFCSDKMASGGASEVWQTQDL